jgi:hypothetical protein
MRPAASTLPSCFLLALSLLVINICSRLTGHSSSLSIWASAEFCLDVAKPDTTPGGGEVRLATRWAFGV